MSTKGGCSGGCAAGGTRKGKKRGLKGGAVFPSFGGPLGGTTAGAEWGSQSLAAPYSSASGAAIPDPYSGSGGGRKMTVKAMKKMLKKAGLKTTGKRAALTRRLKKIRKGMKGGASENASMGMIPSPHSVAGYVGTGSGGLADYVNVSGGVPNQVVPA